MSRRTVMFVFGTRPEAIKLAPVVLEVAGNPRFRPVVAVTAQHRALLDQVLDLFEIRPDFDCNILRDGQTLTDVTVRALTTLAPVVASERPDLVVVQGDTTTAFVGALVAFYHRVPVAHVEAGLRTGDPYSPYPEELNRRLITQLASLHLAPTPLTAENLRAEGVDPARVFVTGNTVIDALLRTVRAGGDRLGTADASLAPLDGDPRRVVLVTTHRRESWGPPMRAVASALLDVARRHPDVVLVCPLHPNPRVREAVVPVVAGQDNILVVEPLAYGPFCQLLNRCHLVVTDSGGIQEEAPSLGKPVLVLRANTERPEGVSAGTVQLVGTDPRTVAGRISELLDDPRAYQAMQRVENPYGDGRAAGRTVAAFAAFFGDGPPPEEFDPQPPWRSWTEATIGCTRVVIHADPAVAGAGARATATAVTGATVRG
jgi:UDP-N-acetylglucosamine 2-epimerase (non-hydrolysing)